MPKKHSRNIIVFKPTMVWKIYYYFPFHFKPNMSPFVCVTIWNKTWFSHQIQNITIWLCHYLKWKGLFISNWICHHLKTFQTSHHLDLKKKNSTFHTKPSYGDKWIIPSISNGDTIKWWHFAFYVNINFYINW